MDAEKKKQALELESKKLIVRFLRDQGGADHRVFFDKNKDIFGPEKSPHRLRSEKFFIDTKRRVYQDPVKFKKLLVSLGVEKPAKTMPGKKSSSSSSKTTKKRDEKKDSDSDDIEEFDEEEERSDDSSEEESKCAFVGSPKPKGKQQPTSAKKNVTASSSAANNDKKGE